MPVPKPDTRFNSRVKPALPVLNDKHPLARGLVGAIIPNGKLATGEKRSWVFGGLEGSTSSSTYATVGKYGKAVALAGDGDLLQVTSTYTPPSDDSPFTAVVIMKRLTAGTINGCKFFSIGAATSGWYQSAYSPGGGSNSFRLYTLSDANVRERRIELGVDAFPAIGKWSVVSCSLQTNTNSATDAWAFADGKKVVGSGYFTAGGGAASGAASAQTYGSTWEGTHEVALLAYWNRVLTDDEHRSLYEDPWALYAPARKWYAVDAVSASTFAPWLQRSRLVVR